MKTAVEWFFWKLYILKEVEFESIMKLYEQAKEMEKEQIMDAYIESGANLEDIIKEAAEDYYNKQFKIN